MPKYHSRHTLIDLTPEKFCRAWDNIMSGKYLYRTWDKRVLNFKLGTETGGIGLVARGEDGPYAIYNTRTKRSMESRIRHINRKNKKRGRWGRRG